MNWWRACSKIINNFLSKSSRLYPLCLVPNKTTPERTSDPPEKRNVGPAASGDSFALFVVCSSPCTPTPLNIESNYLSSPATSTSTSHIPVVRSVSGCRATREEVDVVHYLGL